MVEQDELQSPKKPSGAKISLHVDNRVARIAFNNPPLNAFTLDLLEELSETIHVAAREEGLCAIVFESVPESRAFSVGVAIEDQRGEYAYQMIDALHAVFRNLNFYSKPTIAVVTDAALGAGCELAAFCDIVVASDKARFGLPQVKVGVFPPVASVYLPRSVGLKRANEMILTGALYTAQEAKDYGLVTYVVPDEQIPARLFETLESLRRLSAPVLETARRAISEAAGLPFEEGLTRVEDIYLNHLMSLKDPGEGVGAFLEKRTPMWKHK
jgi:cyclohexa-1,5-dienecarbonyl-CoA hydratase